MGFEPQIRKLVAAMPPKENRQVSSEGRMVCGEWRVASNVKAELWVGSGAWRVVCRKSCVWGVEWRGE